MLLGFSGTFSISAVSLVTDPSEAFSVLAIHFHRKDIFRWLRWALPLRTETRETTEARRMTAFCLVSVILGVKLLYLVYQTLYS